MGQLDFLLWVKKFSTSQVFFFGFRSSWRILTYFAMSTCGCGSHDVPVKLLTLSKDYDEYKIRSLMSIRQYRPGKI